MPNNTDERVVSMRFDNRDFERNAEKSLKTLDRLDSQLNLTSGIKGFEAIGSAIEKVSDRFSAFGIMGATVLSNLTNSVINFSKNVLTAIPRQIIEGGKKRALNIEAAKFQLGGLGIAWGDIYDNIDKAVSGTAYGLDEAAKVAAQLAASGVAYGDAESDMAHALRGISGVAAMTNSSYEEIGSVFSTVAGQGKLMTIQLRQLEARGLNAAATLAKSMGKTEEELRDMVTKGEVDFLTFARAMDDAFGEHATKANETFNGAFSNMKAALSRIGADFATPTIEGLKAFYNEARNVFNNVRKQTRPFAENEFTKWIEIISKIGVNMLGKLDFSWIGKTLSHISGVVNKINEFFGFTEEHVRTISGIVPGITDNVRDLEKELFGNSLSDKLIGEQRLKELKYFADGLKDFALIGVDTIKAIGKAFKTAFPGGNELEIFDKLVKKAGAFGRSLSDLREKLKADETVTKIFSPLIDVFARIVSSVKAINSDDISKFVGGIKSLGELGVNALRAFGRALSEVFPKLGETSLFASFAKTLGGIGDAFSRLAKWSKDEDIFYRIFSPVLSISSKVINVIKTIATFINDLIHAIFNIPDAGTIWGVVADILTTVGSYIITFAEKIKNTISSIGGWSQIFTSIKDKLVGAWNNIKGVLSGLNDGLNDVFGGQGYGEKVFELAAGFAALFVGYRKWDATTTNLKRFGNAVSALFLKFKGFTDIPSKISVLIGRMTGTLRTMQDSLKAGVISKIAASILMLSVGLLILASIDKDKLAGALAALAVGITELMAAMKFMDSNIGNGFFGGLLSGKKFSNLGKLAKSILIIAAAIFILSFAVERLGKLSWDELARGLVGVISLMAAITVMSRFIDGKNMKASMGLGIILLAAGILILVQAVKQLAGLEDGLERSVIALSALFLVLGGFSRLANSKSLGPKTGLGIIMIAAGMLILVQAVKQIADIDPDAIEKSINTIGALFALVGALGYALSGSKNIVGVGISLVLIGAALKIFASSLSAISALGDITSSMKAIVIFFMAVMALSAVGKTVGASMIMAAGSLILFSLALIPFAGAMKMLGGMEWMQILKGLAAIAGAFVILGLAAVILTPVLPIIAALAGVLLLISAALYVAAATVVLLSAGLTAMAAAGAGAAAGFAAALVAIATGLVSAASALTNAIVIFITSFLVTVAASADMIVGALMTMLVSILDSLAESLAPLITSIATLIISLLDGLIDYLPPIIGKVFELLEALLDAIAEALFNSSGIFASVGEIFAALLAGIVDILIPVLDGFADLVAGIVGAAGKFVGSVLGEGVGAFIGGIMEGISAHFDDIAENLGSFVDALKPVVDQINGLGIDEGAMAGLESVARVILTLSEASLVEGFSKIFSIFSGGNSFKKFGDELALLGPGVAAYGEAIKDVDATAIAMSVDAVGAMVDVANKLSGEGGLWQAIAGTPKSLGDFSKELATAAPNIAAFAKEAPTIAGNKDDILAVSEAIEALVKVANAIKPSNQSIAWGLYKSEAQDLGTFAAALGTQILEDGTEVKGVAANLLDFAKSSEELKQYDVTELISTIEKLATIGETVSNLGSNESFAWGLYTSSSNDLGTFISSFTESGSQLKEFASVFSPVEVRKLSVVAEAVERFANIEASVKDIGTDGTAISTFAQGMKDAFAGVQETQAEITGLDWDLMAGALSHLEDYSSRLSSFESWGKTSIKGLMTTLDVEASNGVIQVATSIATKIANAVANSEPSYYSAGAQSAQGLINGFMSKLQQAATAGSTLTEAMIRAIRKTLRIESPSRVMMSLGSYTGEGFVKGLTQWTGKTFSASESLADSVIDPIGSAIAKITAALPDDATVITIRPVLDLSEIENGARDIASILSNSSIVPSLAVSEKDSALEADVQELLDVGWRILREIQNGSDIYLDDKVLAGRINRRLGQV